MPSAKTPRHVDHRSLATTAAQNVRQALRGEFPTGLRADQVVSAVVLGMQCLGDESGLSGAQKKALLVSCLTQFSTEMTDGDHPVDPLLRLIVPTVVDALIEAEKGRLRLRRRRGGLLCC
jgi:hypothetical protein